MKKLLVLTYIFTLIGLGSHGFAQELSDTQVIEKFKTNQVIIVIQQIKNFNKILDSEGNTFLHYAGRYPSKDTQVIVNYAVSRGANPEQKNFHGKSAYEMAPQLYDLYRLIKKQQFYEKMNRVLEMEIQREKFYKHPGNGHTV